MRTVKSAVILLIGVSILGCGFFKKIEQNNSYQNSKRYEKQIIIPSDMRAEGIENKYAVPRIF